MLVTELKLLQSTPAVPELLDIQEYAIEKITQKLEQYPIINEIPVEAIFIAPNLMLPK